MRLFAHVFFGGAVNPVDGGGGEVALGAALGVGSALADGAGSGGSMASADADGIGAGSIIGRARGASVDVAAVSGGRGAVVATLLVDAAAVAPDFALRRIITTPNVVIATKIEAATIQSTAERGAGAGATKLAGRGSVQLGFVEPLGVAVGGGGKSCPLTKR